MIKELKEVRNALSDSKAEFWDDWHSNMSEGDFENHWLIMDIDKSLATLDRIIAEATPSTDALKILRHVNNWSEIETAPKDGGKVLMRKFDTKSPFDGATGYVNYDEYRRVYEELKQENDENCRLLGMSAEREIQLLQKVQQLENQVSCLMQNSESQTQTQIALIKKLEKEKWQPIESAPRDGTRVITCCMSPSEYTSVKAGFMAINGYDEDLASWPLHNKHHFPATHWMPLPEPPTTEETK